MFRKSLDGAALFLSGGVGEDERARAVVGPPDGGEDGGRIVARGTPEEIARCPESATGRFIRA